MQGQQMLAIDLFSGCGGLSIGLEKAKFNIIAAVENEKLAAKVYRLNHKNTHLLEKDIRSVDPKELMQTLGLKEGDLDLLAGCPPCQGFSTLRTKNGSKKIDEPMNDLLFEFIKFVDAFKPKCIMMENVPGLAKDKRIKTFENHLKGKGYQTKYDVFDAADFGVPQHRKRTVFIAALTGTPIFAKKTNRKTTVKDAIGKLHRPGLGKDPLHDYEETRSSKVIKMIAHIPQNGGSRSQLPKELVLACHTKTDGFKDVYGRMHWEKPAPTMTGGCINPSKGRFLHPEQNRAITLREASLIQGFPKNYKFDINCGKYPVAQLIGNAFPPAFAKAHAINLAKLITSKRNNHNDLSTKDTIKRTKRRAAKGRR
ncbi:DNA cytosine methyltransferase [Chitinophaga sp. S165]|uniref:DNA cytosine methyltransferase n=1 Tax=Chitinophaga sp. S165 TaxID=2135462 RepID=UPI000D70A779|nr:DNA cytosine methyltransferase [Chitinophaga sp. S165]PWV45151.1 DNA (cytosine-5)-methyltransferase 1 [Chitinophaga sp. S165]